MDKRSRKPLRHEGHSNDPGKPMDVREQRKKQQALQQGGVLQFFLPAAVSIPGLRKCAFAWAYVYRVKTDSEAGTESEYTEQSG